MAARLVVEFERGAEHGAMIVTVARVWTDGSVVRVRFCVAAAVLSWIPVCVTRSRIGVRLMLCGGVCLVADEKSLRGRRVVGCVYSSPVTGVCVILVHASCRRREIVGAGSMIIEVCFHCISPGVG